MNTWRVCKLHRRCTGVTLVELVISIVLLGLLAAVGSSMILSTFDTTTIVNANQSSAAQARYALERMEREIREVKFTNGSYAIDQMDERRMVFDGLVGGANVKVTICNGATPADTNCGTANTLLTLGYSTVAGAPIALCAHVQGFSLKYYRIDPADNTIKSTGVTTSNIRFVDIELTVKDATGGQSIAQRTRVALRNL